MERRNTIQRDLILQTVRELKDHAAADEIFTVLSKMHPSIGRGTVYRNLNILAEQGEIRKIIIPGEPERFDHNCSEHYHVKCVKCGKVFDVKLKKLPCVTENTEANEDIKIIDYDISFRGICKACEN